MRVRNFHQASVTPHNFAMNPRAPVARSSHPIRMGHKTTMPASFLIPIFNKLTMPGDMFNVRLDAVIRTAIPIVPIMDNWRMTFFAFFTPLRILWPNFEKFMGAQANPGDSISYQIPQVVSPANGFAVSGLGDWFGLGIVGQIQAAAVQTVSALPFRAYSRTWNEWFRDQNLQNSAYSPTNDGPDLIANYPVQKRGKRHDYFTAALPFVQKGNPVTMPIGTTAPIVSTGLGVAFDNASFTRTGTGLTLTSGTNTPTWSNATAAATSGANFGAAGTTITAMQVNLLGATGPAVNIMRTAIATQQLLERDARGGTRYVETIYAHWGVRPPDYRLDRPEYLGGGSIDITTDAIPQTSATGLTGGTTPAGNLAATGSGRGNVGFSYACTEHGYIQVLACATADLTYSQGLERSWSYLTRYDFPFPEFANLGEQTVYNKEIYAIGSASGGVSPGDQDMQPFGYMPRYDECRHFPSMITGLFRPRAAGNIAYWHSSENFLNLPALNATFIQDNFNTVADRNFAAGAAATMQQFLCDFLFTGRAVRPLPTYSVPGLTRF